jgi:hypothetical protein
LRRKEQAQQVRSLVALRSSFRDHALHDPMELGSRCGAFSKFADTDLFQKPGERTEQKLALEGQSLLFIDCLKGK